jgi:uncharacterized protein
VERRLSKFPDRGQRIEIIDALRALALAGILQVNIQSFVWGSGDPLGQFLTIPSPGDTVVHLLIGTFISSKFISIFAFLFGLGAALQFRSIRAALARDLPRHELTAAAQAVYRRRLWFLLGVGLAHGFLLYFGDVLAFYAVCGFVLVWFLPRRPARLVRLTVLWWIAAVSVIAIATLLTESVRRRVAPGGDPTLIPLETLRAFAVYTEAGYLDQLSTRVSDYLAVFESMLIVLIPQIVGLFMLGLLAGRLGWLARPERHRRLWRSATWIGVAAFPFAAYGEWLNFESMTREPGDPSTIGYLLQFVGSAVACLYVALLVRLRHKPWMAALIHWVAPAGRMPLTNYLAQSVLMGFLLSGWGLGLGAEMNRSELALLALVIVAVQWTVSRWWIGRFRTGPMEAWWARATYRTPDSSKSTFNHTPR